MHSRWIAVVSVAGAVGLGCGDDGSGGSGGAGQAGETSGGAATGGGSSASGLSQAEIDSLVFMREEEKLARDVYDALDVYGNPFANIQKSEQSHMDRVLILLDDYGIPDPADGKGPGEFTNQDLLALFGSLVAQGSPTQLDALVVGCTIEELDIRDIEVAKTDVTHGDITATYDALLLGSRNHLRAFYGRLTNLGGSYTPQYVDQATFDAIVSSPKEQP
jgi:hypothetical protein